MLNQHLYDKPAHSSSAGTDDLEIKGLDCASSTEVIRVQKKFDVVVLRTWLNLANMFNANLVHQPWLGTQRKFIPLAELAEISDFHNQRPYMGSNWNLSILRTTPLTTFTLIFTSHLF